jgi:hypothetical protein
MSPQDEFHRCATSNFVPYNFPFKSHQSSSFPAKAGHQSQLHLYFHCPGILLIGGALSYQHCLASPVTRLLRPLDAETEHTHIAPTWQSLRKILVTPVSVRIWLTTARGSFQDENFGK